MKRASVCVALVALSALFTLPHRAEAVPTGLNPYIYGMHDNPGGLLDGPNNCGRGWITELRYIGTDGTCGGGVLDYAGLANAGIGIIMRLDVNGTNQLPVSPADYDGFAASFADCVAQSSGIRVWIVGNEPNIPWGAYVFSPSEYGEIYLRVRQAVKALPDGADHEVLFAAPAIWASLAPWGDWDDGLGAALDYVLAAGGVVDGASIHAYSREHTVSSITSDEWFPERVGKWHLHFRIYRDFLREYAARNLLYMPLYITEAGSVCDPTCDPYQDADLGYFEAMYEEIHTWNQGHPDQIIRAVTPYRWTSNDDGSGRDFCIGCSAPLVQDMNDAIALGRKWHNSDCHEPFTEAPDAGVDAGPPDASVPNDGDVPADAASTDAGDPPDADPNGDGVATGCGCRSDGGLPGTPTLWLLVLTLWVIRRRRRDSRRRRRGGGPSAVGLLALVLPAIVGFSVVGCQQVTARYSRTGANSAPKGEGGCRFDVYTMRPAGAFQEVGFLEFDFAGLATAQGLKSVAEVRRLAADHVCKAGGNALLLWPANDSGMFKKATILKLVWRAAAGPVPRPRARARATAVGPRPRAVPFFHDIRMGMTEAELARVIRRYAQLGYWKPADFRRGRIRSMSRPAAGGPVETHVGPEFLKVKLHAVPWLGREVRLTGQHSELELRFEKGKLAKVELNARGYLAPGFTLRRLVRYLRRLQPDLKTRVAQARFKVKGKAGRFEVEVKYDAARGSLEVEVEWDVE